MNRTSQRKLQRKSFSLSVIDITRTSIIRIHALIWVYNYPNLLFFEGSN